ncbi:MAG TPA: hypothetical protein VFE58_10085 [Tepidisphaeraceae bacterium]|jgi:hypothetical protein|nr:hypothetical protein [Tepidisphaeraceae bacterium]
MKNVKRAAQLAAVLALGMGASVGWGASTVEYSLGNGSSVSVLSSDPGLVLQTSLALTLPNTFTLNDGDSTLPFSFFNIWTNEADVNLDDLVPMPITAMLDFALPAGVGTVEVDGQTRGELVVRGTLKSGGVVSWDGPAEYTNSAGLDFTVTLSDETFNLGPKFQIGTLDPGNTYGATVTAMVHQISSPDIAAGPLPTAVPTPEAGVAGMVLMAGMGFWKRMRKGK